MRTFRYSRKPLHRNRVFVAALAAAIIFGSVFPVGAASAGAAEETSNQAQSAAPSERQELVQQRTLTNKYFKNPDGKITAEVSQFPVHYKDQSGTLQDADNTLEDRGPVVKAEKTYLKTELPKLLDAQGNVARLQVGGRPISLRVRRPVKDALANPGSSVAQVGKDSVTYRDLLPGASFSYQVLPNGLKEEISLASAEAPAAYDFELAVSGANVAASPSGDLVFTDAANGSFLFILPKPFMYDNPTAPIRDRALSDAVRYEVSKSGETFQIKVIADSAWLKQPARKFPVVIDPTITVTPPHFSAFADTCSPNTPHYSEPWMLGGTNTGCTRRSYVYFANLPTLPAGAAVSEAKLQLYQYEVTNATALATINRVNAGWNASTLTWNNQPAYGNPLVTHTDGASDGLITPDVTSIFTSWSGYGGTAPNNGFMLSVSPESGAGSSTRTWRTGNYPDGGQHPKLKITYSAPYSAEFVDQTTPSATAEGEEFTQTVRYRNTGTKTWYPDGAEPVRLGTEGPKDRASDFHTDDGHWISTSRVKLDQQLVRPGDVGSFTFKMRAPPGAGTYTESFRPVADGYSWLENSTNIVIPVVDPSYGSAWQGQSHSSLTLAQGQTASVWIDIKNTGNTTWQRDNGDLIRLGTSNAQNRASSFMTSGDWLSNSRASNADKDKVPPGATVRFSFTVTAPSSLATGTYNEYFTPVLDGLTWLTDQGIYIPLTVVSGSPPSANNLGEVAYAASAQGVNITNGNLVLSANDVNLAARGIPLKLDRTYNSQDDDSSTMLGKGWRFDFEQRLDLPADEDTVTWYAEDGQRFTYQKNGSSYTRPPNTQFDLTKDTSVFGEDTFVLQQNKHLKLRFHTASDKRGRLKEVEDGNGNKLSFTYDSGKLVKITDASGRDVNLAYDTGGKLASIADFASRTVRYEYAGGQLSKVIDATNNAGTFTYDSSQRLIETVDPKGARTKYDYDSASRVSAVTDAKELDQTTPKSTQFTYGTDTAVKDPKDQTTNYQFNNRGQVTKITAPDATVRHNVFDKDFNRLVATNPDGGQQQSEYDGSGNLVRQTDELGNVTVSTYDANFDNVLTTTNPKGVQQKFEYNSSGNRTKEYADFSNEPTKFTEHDYDSQGNRTKVTEPNGNTTSYDHDSHGRVTKETAPPSSDPKLTEYTYDAAGNRLTVKDPRLKTTTFEYDAKNQLTKETDPVGNAVRTSYDAIGNKLAETDARNLTTNYEYDKLGQLTKTISPDAIRTTTYEYDKNGNVSKVTDAKGTVTTIAHDAKDRPTAETTGGVTTSLTYNANDDVTKTVEGSGSTQTTTNLTVDKAGQTTKEDNIGAGATGKALYQYDANGNVTESTDQSGVAKVEYDGKDLVKKETDANGGQTQATYDANGNVTQLTTPSGKKIDYTYDQNDQVKDSTASVTANSVNQNIVNPVVKTGSSATTEQSNIEYDKNGNTTKVTKANGDYSEMVYDDANRLTGLTTKTVAGAVISSYSYGYDGNGNVTSLNGDGLSWNFTYDALNQLLWANDTTGRAWMYTYDTSGNRTVVAAPDGTTNYSYGDAADKNRLTSSVKNGATMTYGYDSKGNNTTRSDGTSIVYDGDGAVTSAKIGSGPTVTYGYDAEKRMISRIEGTNVTRYQHDGDKLSAETDGDGKVLASYTYDDKGKLFSQTRKDIADPTNPNAQNKVYYYHYDNRGNVTSITDPGGTVVKRYGYDPFGNILTNENPTGVVMPNAYTYSGYWQDQTTKLYYLKARWYDAQIGRFLSVDPDPSNDDPKQDDVLNANLYLYTNNNPITNVDPTGLGKCGWNPKNWGQCGKDAWNNVGNAVNKVAEPVLQWANTPAKFGVVVAGVTTAAATSPIWARAALPYWRTSRAWAPRGSLGSYGNMLSHWSKHVINPGRRSLRLQTPGQYTRNAKRLIRGGGAVFKQGARTRVLNRGGHFAVSQRNKIVTYFKPKRGAKDYNKQLSGKSRRGR